MASTQQLIDLQESLDTETQEELTELFEKDHDSAVKSLIDLAAKQDIKTTKEEIDEYLSQIPEEQTSISIEQFESLRKELTPEVEQEITALIMTDYDAGVDRIVEVASSKGVNIPEDEVDMLIEQLNSQMKEDDEGEDVELDAVALTAVAGGRRSKRSMRRRSRRSRRIAIRRAKWAMRRAWAMRRRMRR